MELGGQFDRFFHELSNHLGNVLSVINDRKIVPGSKLLLQDNLEKNNPWEIFGTVANLSVEKDILTATNVIGKDSGIYRTLPLQAVGTYALSFTTYQENGIPLILQVINSNNNIIFEEQIETTSQSNGGYHYIGYVSVPATGHYRIELRSVETSIPVTFSISNFSITQVNVDGVRDFVSTFEPDVLAFNEYYPFGMLVPNRHASSDDYRYGFNGMEKDDELKGEGNSLNYTFRMHDPRVGRFFATDPLQKAFHWNSPYAFSEKRVIDAFELEGAESVLMHGTLSPGEKPMICGIKKIFAYDYICSRFNRKFTSCRWNLEW